MPEQPLGQREATRDDAGGDGDDGKGASGMKFPPVVHRLRGGVKMPTCVIMVGMAGSGKTTLLTQLQRSLEATAQREQQQREQQQDAEGKKRSAVVDGDSSKGAEGGDDGNDDDEDDDIPCRYYCVNLDPAAMSIPYDVNIDIRDTVDYSQVMRQHKLGPNGAIMTSLNLFATKFDQVIGILESRAFPDGADVRGVEGETKQKSQHSGDEDDDDDAPMDYILVDTPGQIEAFTWSASGTIIGESLASSFPTVLCFVVDTVRCASSPNTFMSNMLYACSMLYRTRLPLVVCFNKTDVTSHEFCLEWMRDHESFQEALDVASSSSSEGDFGFYGSLTRSMSLALDQFYSGFVNSCGVSAVTGDGIQDFWTAVDNAATRDFATDYVEDLQNRIEEQHARKRAEARNDVRRMQRDLDSA